MGCFGKDLLQFINITRQKSLKYFLLQVQLESRRELDCLIKYINDEVDSTTMNKYAIGLYGESDKGVWQWVGKTQGVTPDHYDDQALSFSNW